MSFNTQYACHKNILKLSPIWGGFRVRLGVMWYIQFQNMIWNRIAIFWLILLFVKAPNWMLCTGLMHCLSHI